jgi:hypothetical protein
MQVRALARLVTRRVALALAAAVTEYERRRPETDPAWFQYFDEAELSAEFGHCLRDLSRAKDAAAHAGRSVGASVGGRFAHSDFFATMVLADSCLAAGAGEAELACEVALGRTECQGADPVGTTRKLPAGILRASGRGRGSRRGPGLR